MGRYIVKLFSDEKELENWLNQDDHRDYQIENISFQQNADSFRVLAILRHRLA